MGRLWQKPWNITRAQEYHLEFSGILDPLGFTLEWPIHFHSTLDDPDRVTLEQRTIQFTQTTHLSWKFGTPTHTRDQHSRKSVSFNAPQSATLLVPLCNLVFAFGVHSQIPLKEREHGEKPYYLSFFLCCQVTADLGRPHRVFKTRNIQRWVAICLPVHSDLGIPWVSPHK